MARTKTFSKVIGCFAYTLSGEVLCDGDACVISGTEEKMRFYLKKLAEGGDEYTIKKTRFGEIMTGIGKGAAYAFDEGAYSRFLPQAIKLKMDGLPSDDFFTEPSSSEVHFLRIQFFGN